MTKFRVYINTLWAETFEARNEVHAKQLAMVRWLKDYDHETARVAVVNNAVIEVRPYDCSTSKATEGEKP